MKLTVLLPVATNTSLKECIYGALGAAVGLIGTEWLCQWLLGFSVHWLIAPIGASAVLLFAAPASPLAQPWSILVGNVVSAIVGVTCAKLIGDVAMASGVGVMLAIAAMFLTRSLHPPGGAVALTAVIGGSAITGLSYHFVLIPVAINSAIILLIALIYNQALGRRYPNRPAAAPAPHHTSDPAPSQRLGVNAADIDFALQQHGELLDISREDLQSLLQDAQLHARRERADVISCQQLMSRDVITIGSDENAQAAWDKLAHHQVKALPVLDGEGYLAGIISLHDLLIDPASQLPRASTHWAEQSIASLMTRDVQYARPEQPLVELVPLFSDGGLHHLPVVDQRRVVGIITQSDMVAALFSMPRSTAA